MTGQESEGEEEAEDRAGWKCGCQRGRTEDCAVRGDLWQKNSDWMTQAVK